MLTHKRNELCLELVVQLSVHLTMVLLSQTKYPIETGLQALFTETTADTTLTYGIAKEVVKDVSVKVEDIFKDSALVFFVFSTVWSFKTSAKTSIRIKNEAKVFLPLEAKLILFWRYFLIFLIRISCIVSYFLPFIGLLDTMTHFHAEKMGLDYDLFKIFCQI